MRIRDVPLALATMLLWGLNFAVAKQALAERPPVQLTALRSTLMAPILLPLAPRPERSRPSMSP
jgi:drug/metabolite transporter (DMT)-like permease